MKRGGFTLLELMIVVAIIMILGGGGLWTLRGRAEANEMIKMKTEIPTIIQNATMEIYQKGISGATIAVTGDSISISNVGSGAEYRAKSSLFVFSTSPASLTTAGAIDTTGTFKGDFDILVTDKKTSNTVLTFSIFTKENLGVYSLTVSQSAF